MLLGDILKQLGSAADSAAFLDTLGDIVLFTEVAEVSALYGESAAEYAQGAVQRFAASASDEDWLALTTALERSHNPATTALHGMVRWSLANEVGAAADDQHLQQRGPRASACTCGDG